MSAKTEELAAKLAKILKTGIATKKIKTFPRPKKNLRGQ